MRRATSLGFFLFLVACAIVLYVRLQGREAATAPVAPGAPTKPEPTAPPAASPPPRLAVPPRSPDASRHVQSPAALAEPALMQQIRALVKSEPQRAEALAREARRRFPDGAEADERDALLVDALINQQRIGAARDETYYYFDHHPNGRFAEHLFVMTGVHPRPSRPTP
jgi:hypothetical protein